MSDPRGDRLNGMARTAILVAGLSALALGLTLIWHLTVARSFGASPQLDAFWIGFAIPRTITESFHYGLLTLLFVLVLNRSSSGDADEAERLGSSVLNLVLLGTVALVLVLVVAAPVVVAATAPGLGAEPARLATSLLRRLAPVLGLTAILGALGGLAIARGRVALFAASRAAAPALQVATLLLLVGAAGVDALVPAVWAGAVGAAVLYAPHLRRLGFRYRPLVDLRGPEARSLSRLVGALCGVWVLVGLNQASDRFFASLLGPGRLSALEFAWRFEIPITQVVSLGVALPTLALLARSASAESREEFRGVLGNAGRLLSLSALPAIGLLVVLREPLTSLWLQRGAFDERAAAEVSSLLPWLAPVFLCRAFSSVLVFGLLTLRRGGVLLAAVAAEVGVNTALNLWLGQVMGLPGIATATAIAMVASNLFLWRILLAESGAGALLPMLVRARAPLGAVVLAVIGAMGLRAVAFGAAAAAGLALVAPLLAVGIGFGALYLALCLAGGVVELRRGPGLPRLRLRTSG